jgi:hypothetical protein
MGLPPICRVAPKLRFSIEETHHVDSFCPG